MPTQRKRPADFTGIQTERLNAEKAESLKERANEIALSHETAAVEKTGIIDYTGSDTPVVIETAPVEVNDPYVNIRVNSPIEQMTFGRQVLDPGDPETGRPPAMGDMNTFTFEEGQAYKVPRELADHLDSKGYLSYRGS